MQFSVRSARVLGLRLRYLLLRDYGRCARYVPLLHFGRRRPRAHPRPASSCSGRGRDSRRCRRWRHRLSINGFALSIIITSHRCPTTGHICDTCARSFHPLALSQEFFRLRQNFFLQDADELRLFCRSRIRNIMTDEDGAEAGYGECVKVEVWGQVFQSVRHSVVRRWRWAASRARRE